MRFLLAIGLIFTLTTVCDRSFAQDEFPYTVTVKRDGATVHSGPAKVHYMTCRLKAGDTIEVYRHDPNGWLAIRPVEQDFSLVRAKYVLANFGKGTGQITSDGIRSWVGTESTDENEPLWQIQFRKGDRVRLKGKQQIEDTSGTLHSWYEIAPPAGEFRWIHESALKDQVESNPAETNAVASKSNNEEVVANSNNLIEIPDGGVDANTDVLVQESQTPNKPDWHQVESSVVQQQTPELKETVVVQAVVETGALVPKPFQPEKFDATHNGSIFPKRQHLQVSNERVDAQPASVNQEEQSNWRVASGSPGFNEESPRTNKTTSGVVNHSTSNTNSLNEDRTAEPNRLGQFESEPVNDRRDLNQIDDANPSLQTLSEQANPAFDDQLRAFEIALTQEVLAPTDQWQLPAYHDAAMQLSRSATSTPQRRQVNRLLEKLDSFENLQRRHRTINRVGYQSDLQDNSASSLSPTQNAGQSMVREAVLETRSNSLVTDNCGDQQQIGFNAIDGDSVVVGTGTVNAEEAAQGSSVDDKFSIYDAKGWLSRLYTGDGRGQAAYAIQDASGNILHTILPAPGVNLDRYLNKEVGIIGRSGFNRKYNKPHVTANRVVELERHR